MSIRLLVPGVRNEGWTDEDIDAVFVCGSCEELRGPSGLRLDLRSFICPNCWKVWPADSPAGIERRCTHCYVCPRCETPLHVCDEKRSIESLLSPKDYPVLAKTGQQGPTLMFNCFNCEWNSNTLKLNANSLPDLLKLTEEVGTKDSLFQTLVDAQFLLRSNFIKTKASARLRTAEDSFVKPKCDDTAVAFNAIHRSSGDSLMRSGRTLLETARTIEVDLRHSLPKATERADKVTRIINRLTEVEMIQNRRVHPPLFNTLLTARIIARMHPDIFPISLQEIDDAIKLFDHQARTNLAAKVLLRTPSVHEHFTQLIENRRNADEYLCSRLGPSDLHHVYRGASSTPQRVRLRTQWWTLCKSCDRPLLRQTGFILKDSAQANYAARCYLPRVRLHRVIRQDFVAASEMSPPQPRFPLLGSIETSMLWMLLTIRNVRADGAKVRLLTDQFHSDAPSAETAVLSQTLGSLACPATNILDLDLEPNDVHARILPSQTDISTSKHKSKWSEFHRLLMSTRNNTEVADILIQRTNYGNDIRKLLVEMQKPKAIILAEAGYEVAVLLPLIPNSSVINGHDAKVVLPGCLKGGGGVSTRFVWLVKVGVIDRG